MFQILSIIAPLFLIIFASAFLRKFFKLGENWSQTLNEFALNIGLPALIFSALSKASFSLQSELSLIISNFIFVIFSFCFGAIVGKIFKLNKKIYYTLFLCFAFNNTAYLGIPVLTQSYGTDITAKLSLIISIYILLMFTLGTGYLDMQKEKNTENVIKNTFKNISKNPLLISVILGLIFSGLHIQIPNIIQESLKMLSASVTPLVLTVIGLFIGSSKFGKLKDWTPVIAYSLATLILLPLLFYFTLKSTGYSPANFKLSILEAAMPLAITPFALADKYNLDKEFIARAIVLSTILSAISLPIWISILS